MFPKNDALRNSTDAYASNQSDGQARSSLSRRPRLEVSVAMHLPPPCIPASLVQVDYQKQEIPKRTLRANPQALVYLDLRSEHFHTSALINAILCDDLAACPVLRRLPRPHAVHTAPDGWESFITFATLGPRYVSRPQ